jgi:O6-methylguanine-DNA--protein-cysteine methyltransferase
MKKTENEAIQLGSEDVEFNNRVLSALSQIAAGKAASLKDTVDELQRRVSDLEKPETEEL